MKPIWVCSKKAMGGKRAAQLFKGERRRLGGLIMNCGIHDWSTTEEWHGSSPERLVTVMRHTVARWT